MGRMAAVVTVLSMLGLDLMWPKRAVCGVSDCWLEVRGGRPNREAAELALAGATRLNEPALLGWPLPSRWGGLMAPYRALAVRSSM